MAVRGAQYKIMVGWEKLRLGVGTPMGITQNDLHQEGDSPTSGDPNHDHNIEASGTPNPDRRDPMSRVHFHLEDR